MNLAAGIISMWLAFACFFVGFHDTQAKTPWEAVLAVIAAAHGTIFTGSKTAPTDAPPTTVTPPINVPADDSGVIQAAPDANNEGASGGDYPQGAPGGGIPRAATNPQAPVGASGGAAPQGASGGTVRRVVVPPVGNSGGGRFI